MLRDNGSGSESGRSASVVCNSMEGIDEIGLDVGATLALGIGATSALAQTKEVTFAHQDMVVPFRVLQAAGDSEKATGYKINWKMFGGGGDVIKAMASGEVPIGEVGSSPRDSCGQPRHGRAGHLDPR